MSITEHFKTITKIPHCSGATKELENFLVSFAKDRGFEVSVDQKGNIFAYKGKRDIAFQAHYDMVCVGKAPNIELLYEDRFLFAKESSLGADNGIAVAMMMEMIDEGINGEYIFTNDEEIGLIGAGALEFDLKAKYMLNLDSEDEAQVYIGCAGGVDIKAFKEYEKSSLEGDFYEINIQNLPGGHSGVQIDQNIPNAIKVFGDFLKDKDVQIAYLKGGERINSIPTTLRAIISSPDKISNAKMVDVVRFKGRFEVCKNSNEIISLINGFKNGVLSYNKKLNIPQNSINLALIDLKDGVLSIESSARSMSNDDLEDLKISYEKYLKSYRYQVSTDGKYPAWKPSSNEFTELVCKVVKGMFNRCELKAIHAGLECAIISDIYPHIKIASIGPTITSPHSTNEKVDLESVERTYKVVREIAKVI